MQGKREVIHPQCSQMAHYKSDEVINGTWTRCKWILKVTDGNVQKHVHEQKKDVACTHSPIVDIMIQAPFLLEYNEQYSQSLMIQSMM